MTMGKLASTFSPMWATLLLLAIASHFTSSSLIQRPGACDITVLVRADDLQSGTTAHGHATLINNITSSKAQSDCLIDSWTLILRHRERVALRYPIPSLTLPEEPTYNYSLDARRILRRIRQTTENDELFESQADPYHEEREKYNKRLQEYAKALRSKEHWITRESESTSFEIRQSFGALDSSVDGFQTSLQREFGIAVPGVELATKSSNTFKSITPNDNLTYVEELDFAYFAQVSLQNGSSFEMRAGYTTFEPTTDSTASTTKLNRVVRWNESDLATFNSRPLRIENNRQVYAQERLANLDLTVELDEIPSFHLGGEYRLNGTVSAKTDDYVVENVVARLEYRIEPTEALRQLREQNRLDLTEQLEQSTDFPPSVPRNAMWSSLESIGSRLQTHKTATQFLNDAWTYEQTTEKDACSRPFWSAPKRTSHVINMRDRNSFSVPINVSLADAVTTIPSAYTRTRAQLTMEVHLRGANKTAEQQSSTEVHAQNLDQFIKRWMDPQNKTQCSRMQPQTHITLIHVFGDVHVYPPDTDHPSVILRNSVEERNTDHMVKHHYLSPLARAPTFVPVELTNDRIRDTSEEQFKLMNDIRTGHDKVYDPTKPTVDGVNEPFGWNARKWTDNECRSHGAKRHIFSKGSCSTHVGKLWAESVLLDKLRSLKQEVVDEESQAMHLTFQSQG